MSINICEQFAMNVVSLVGHNRTAPCPGACRQHAHTPGRALQKGLTPHVDRTITAHNVVCLARRRRAGGDGASGARQDPHTENAPQQAPCSHASTGQEQEQQLEATAFHQEEGEEEVVCGEDHEAEDAEGGVATQGFFRHGPQGTARFFKLVPLEGGEATLEIDGVKMHVTSHHTPTEGAKEKVKGRGGIGWTALHELSRQFLWHVLCVHVAMAQSMIRCKPCSRACWRKQTKNGMHAPNTMDGQHAVHWEPPLPIRMAP